MADLTELQSADTVKIAGANPSTGVESNFMQVDASGNAQAIINNAAGGSSVNIQDGGNSITIDATSLPLPTGASTAANQTTANTSLASIDTKTPALVSGRQPVDGSGVTQPISAAALPLPSGASTSANQATANASLSSLDGKLTSLGQKALGTSVPVVSPSEQTSGSAIPTISTLIGGSDGTNQRAIVTDSAGRLIVTSLTGFNANFTFGDVATAATTRVPVRRAAYTEQATNAQRSIVSSSANDTSAGTGAQQVIITYYDQAGAGPSTETVTLNGTTAVNTVSTTICFIESIVVSRVGSTGSNVGALTLKAAAAGAGVTICTVNATDNLTIWGHHYIATGKTCNITGLSVSHNGTTVGSGGVFQIYAKPINVTGPVDRGVSDFVRLYGQSSTFTRSYVSPIKVVGPAVIRIDVTPETGSSTIYRASIDFFET